MANAFTAETREAQSKFEDAFFFAASSVSLRVKNGFERVR